MKTVIKNGFILATIFLGQKIGGKFLAFLYWKFKHISNKPFPSCPKPLFQSEAKCETIDMKLWFFYSYANKTPFHNKGFALSRVLNGGVFETRNWFI